jgi:hypothetical protein
MVFAKSNNIIIMSSINHVNLSAKVITTCQKGKNEKKCFTAVEGHTTFSDLREARIGTERRELTVISPGMVIWPWCFDAKGE